MSLPIKQLEYLVGLAEKATIAPWVRIDDHFNPSMPVVRIEQHEGAWRMIAMMYESLPMLLGKTGREQALANGAFIEAARNSIPALVQHLAESERLRTWFLKQGYHSSRCLAYGWGVGTDSGKRDCTCGFEELYAALRPLEDDKA